MQFWWNEFLRYIKKNPQEIFYLPMDHQTLNIYWSRLIFTRLGQLGECMEMSNHVHGLALLFIQPYPAIQTILRPAICAHFEHAKKQVQSQFRSTLSSTALSARC